MCHSKFVDTTVDSGNTVPMNGITMANKHMLIRTVIIHTTVLKNKFVSHGMLNAITEFQYI